MDYLTYIYPRQRNAVEGRKTVASITQTNSRCDSTEPLTTIGPLCPQWDKNEVKPT